jgi:PKD repeat protein
MLLLTTSLFLAAQSTYTVFGNVVTSAGIPVRDWPVYQAGLPNADLVFTDAAGTFLLPVTLPAGDSMVNVATFNCDGASLTQSVFVLLPGIPLLFSICDSIVEPPLPTGCEAGFGYNPTNTLEVSFNSYAYNYDDSLATFTFTWDFGDGTTGTGPEPVHTYSSAGFYMVQLVATSAGCSDTIQYSVEAYDFGLTKTVTISGHVTNLLNQQPIPGWWVNAYGVNPFILGFGTTDATGYYQFDLLVSDTATNVLVETYDMCTFAPAQVNAPIISGIAGFTAQADFTICFDTIIIINPPGFCQAYINYNQTDSLTFAFSAIDWSGAPIVDYLWDFGDGVTSTSATPTHTYTQQGLYTVSLQGMTADSCTAFTSAVVCALPGGGPIDTFFYNCQAYFWAYPYGFALDYRTFKFESLAFGLVTDYAWDFGDGNTSTEASPIHVYAQDGTYNVTLFIETADGCESTIVMQIVAGNNPINQWDCQAMFLPLPIPDSIGVPRSFVFVDMSNAPFGVQSYLWDFGDGTTSNEANPFHTYAQTGIYTVSLTIVSDSCTSVMTMTLDTANPLISPAGSPLTALGQNGITATDDLEDVLGSIKLYPNPVVDAAVLTFDAKTAADYTYSVLDVTGRILSSDASRATEGTNVLPINTASLTPGMYLLRLQSVGGVSVVKFVKN